MRVLLASQGLPQWRTVYQIYALNGRSFSILTGKAGGLFPIKRVISTYIIKEMAASL